MRSHLLRNQDGQLIPDTKLPGHGIGSRVGANGKFPQGQPLMIAHDYLLHQRPALGSTVLSSIVIGNIVPSGIVIGNTVPSGTILSSTVIDSTVPGGTVLGIPAQYSPIRFKITAGKLRDPSILKPHPKVFELIILHIHIAHMQKPFCPGQDRRGEHLAQWNIHIGNTVLKVRFPARVIQGMEHHLHTGLVIVPSGYDYMPGLMGRR